MKFIIKTESSTEKQYFVEQETPLSFEKAVSIVGKEQPSTIQEQSETITLIEKID